MKKKLHVHVPRFEDQYVMGRVLGDGNFSVVRLCQKKGTDEKYAVKCIKKSSLNQKDVDNIQRELEVLKKLKHSHIVKLIEIFDDDEMCFIVMEYMKGGELFDRIIAKEHYTEAEAKNVICTTADVLVYCHAQGIAHRDLKPENLLYESTEETAEIKIADFGFAKIASENVVMSTMCGTPGYFAPEVIARRPYEQKCDVWSLGVITYILLSGFPPFYDDNQVMEMEKIRKAEYSYPSPYFDNVSPDAKDLIDKMLVVDPEQRISAQEVLDHPWLKDADRSITAEEIAQSPALNHVSINLNRNKDFIKTKFKASVNAILLLNKTQKFVHGKKLDN